MVGSVLKDWSLGCVSPGSKEGVANISFMAKDWVFSYQLSD